MHDNTTKWIKRIEYSLLISTATVSLVIAILDVSGLLDSNSWISQRVSAVTLLCVGFIAGYLILERRNKIDVIADSIRYGHEAIMQTVSQSTANTIRALSGVEVTAYATREDFAKRLLSQLKRAKRVDDLLWGVQHNESMSRKDSEATEKYSENIEEFLRRPDVIWREIDVFTEKRFGRSKSRILNPETRGFNIGYLDLPPTDNIPRISFMIVDKEDLFLFNLPNAENLRLHIKHPDIVFYFSKYYEALWQACAKLKHGGVIDYQRIEELEKKLTRTLA